MTTIIMKRIAFASICVLTISFLPPFVRADQTNVAEDDASQEAYNGGFDNGKNGGSGFGEWKMTTEGNDENRHSGFFVATTDNNKDLNGIAKNGKAWGLFANGTGFEQAVAYRAFAKPLAVGDSFSFMMENGAYEKKFETDDPAGASVGLTLRTSNATDSTNDYNKDAVFEFGYYQGKPNYQIYDGSGEDKTDFGRSVYGRRRFRHCHHHGRGQLRSGNSDDERQERDEGARPKAESHGRHHEPGHLRSQRREERRVLQLAAGGARKQVAFRLPISDLWSPCARRGSNAQPTASEAVTLSS